MKAQGGYMRLGDICTPTLVTEQGGLQALNLLEERITGLFDELRGPIYRYLVCLGVSPAEAEEAVQETFLRLYRHLHAGRRDDNLRGWTFRVAHNIGINSLKSRKYVAPSLPEEGEEFTRPTVDSAPSPEEILLRKEKIIRARAAISSLSEQQKECLYLRAEGFRYREIADILEVSISTVAESLRRAIKKLIRGTDG